MICQNKMKVHMKKGLSNFCSTFTFWDYDRLEANGRTGKQALIAVMNKLLKQVFAVTKNGIIYQPNYCSQNHKNYLVLCIVHVSRSFYFSTIL